VGAGGVPVRDAFRATAVCGADPDDEEGLKSAILRGALRLTARGGKGYPEAAKELVKRMLTPGAASAHPVS